MKRTSRYATCALTSPQLITRLITVKEWNCLNALAVALRRRRLSREMLKVIHLKAINNFIFPLH